MTSSGFLFDIFSLNMLLAGFNYAKISCWETIKATLFVHSHNQTHLLICSPITDL